MPKSEFSTIYHPSYIPNKNWVKLQLLFWDKIYRIVPYAMNDLYGDSKIEEIFGLEPKWLPAEEPSSTDLDYFDRHKDSIKEAFKQIKINDNLRFEDPNNFGVHPNKAPEWVFEYLEKLKLATLIKSDERQHTIRHHLVHPSAGELILSCLGSNMARRRGIDAITDRTNNYYVTAANEISSNLMYRPAESAEGIVGCTVLETKIPTDLDKLAFNDIITIRSDYTGLRQAFHKTVKTLSQSFSLEKIVDKKNAEEKFAECVNEYVTEHRKFNSYHQKFSRTIKDWKTQSFGVALSLSSDKITEDPNVALILKVAGVSLTLLGKVLPVKFSKEETQGHQYLQKLNAYIDAKQVIENMREYIYPPVRGLT